MTSQPYRSQKSKEETKEKTHQENYYRKKLRISNNKKYSLKRRRRRRETETGEKKSIFIRNLSLMQLYLQILLPFFIFINEPSLYSPVLIQAIYNVCLLPA